MCMIEEADDWRLFWDKERTARKPHTCGECGRTIHPGERYHYSTGLLDYADSWLVHKQCLQCLAAARWLVEVCGGWVFDGVEQELREHWEEDDLYRNRSFGRLIARMRWNWRSGTGLVPVEQVSAWVDEALAGLPKATLR